MTPRPRKKRTIGRPPFYSGFTPLGKLYEDTQEVVLEYEEYESLKLADYDGLTHMQAAQAMNVSRPTFTRIYEAARRKVATALWEMRPIIFLKGNSEFDAAWMMCSDCDSVFRLDKPEREPQCPVCGSDLIRAIIHQDAHEHRNRWRQRGKEGCFEEYCVCPGCGNKILHTQGIPCRNFLCPDCHIGLVREDTPQYRKIMESKARPGQASISRDQLVAIPVQGSSGDPVMNERFGRSAYFAFLSASGELLRIDKNPAVDQPQGAGTYVVEWLVNQGVGLIVAMEFGPKAKDMLDRLGVKMILEHDAGLTVHEISKKYLKT